ncbi:MAG: tripartite tricarboxylate transporter permease, partial [Chloroflexota bacterium]|nr:tripartite tricarboxylate transporter permease [Chloroflexota bacterium]
MNPVLAIGFLEGCHAAVATGGAVTSILINVPGESTNAATCLDGYPMTKRGEGGRALGASAMASGVGGLIGAVALFCLLPVVRPLVLALGPAEIFAMVLVGITMIAYVGEGSTGKALIAGLLGLMFSFIGDDPSTGVLRYTFGQTFLQDGLELVAVLIGLFAFAEMLLLIKDKKGIVEYELTKASFAQVWEGCLDCFRHFGLLVRTSLIGTLVGLVPGLGGTVASFIAYGHAVQTSKKGAPFGSGRIEGVIAPEAANNSKEGGNLVPTIAFGIPSNASMALVLGALMILGLSPGPKMLKE